MKKILSFLIVLGALTFINVDLFAYTFNGSYDFSNINLDTPLTELNGASLNDLFDYNYFEDLYLAELPNGVRSKFELDGNQVVFNQYVHKDIILESELALLNDINNIQPIAWNKPIDYIGYGSTNANLGTIIIRDYNQSSFYSSIVSTNNHYEYTSRWSGTAFVIVAPDNTYLSLNEVINDFAGKEVIYQLSTPIQNLDIIQSLYFYNLENINIDLLNYYYAVWLLNTFNLPVGDLWSYAFTAGNDSGYLSGYNDGINQGYDSGYTDGINEGYLNGLAEYHFGRDYGSFNYESGIPYLSGFDNGYNAGEQTGYNQGLDYAATNNLTLLSIFELIIGVVINMLTFIITIEVFGISILSLLSTAALLVGVVWILKLVRG